MPSSVTLRSPAISGRSFPGCPYRERVADLQQRCVRPDDRVVLREPGMQQQDEGVRLERGEVVCLSERTAARYYCKYNSSSLSSGADLD